MKRPVTKRKSRGRLTREFVVQLSLALGFLLSSLIFYVWTRYHAVHLGYDLGTISRQERALFEEQQALNLELNNLTSLERVERVARRDFAMHEPRPEQIVFLSTESVGGKP